MTHYLLFSLGSIGYLWYEYLVATPLVYGASIPRSEYFSPIAPLLVAIGAGLFLLRRRKTAAILTLVGISIASKDVLGNWFLVDLMWDSRYVLKYFAFLISSTAYLFVLGFIAVKELASLDNSSVTYLKNRRYVMFLAWVPTALIVIATIWWFCTKNSEGFL